MKKILCVLLCFVFLMGCRSGKSPTVINRNIAYRAHIFYYGEEYNCLVTVKNDGRAEYVIKDGSMDGFCAMFCDDTVSYSYLGKESTTPVSIDKGMLSVIYLMGEEANGKNAEKKDENCIVKGNTAMGEFNLFVSGTGFPLYAELDGKDFYVNFYDVSVINDG